jgi:hypothetical protein
MKDMPTTTIELQQQNEVIGVAPHPCNIKILTQMQRNTK